ncbi:hypothetical protein dsx2_3427 [Desulfovibrio sp. X2]|uniref:ABC transporter permease subunit n=1 Tax=Desulfovibrio sp. X2 TaxID=941449 RepID=UPI0003587CAA|nr:ABC transporter permease subunit [Desulfovibrio sp. X2]EPR39181.1 hypothetical protein dsx2_3427 [Desulfovibrio sp. X2]
MGVGGFSGASGLRAALAAEARRGISRPAMWLLLLPVPLAGALAALVLPGGGDVAAVRAVQALTATFWPLLPLLATALSLAQERQAGIFAQMVSGPLSRGQFLAAKAIGAFVFLMVGGFALSAGAAAAAAMRGGLWRADLLLGLAVLNPLSLTPVISLGLLCAALSRTTVQAGLLALGLHLVLDAAGGAMGGSLLVHTGVWGIPFERVQDVLAGLPPEPLRSAALLSWLAWTLLPLACAWLVLERRDPA